MEIANQSERLKVIKFRKNYGQTAAMAGGIDQARGTILITMDGDLQNDPADIPKFLEKISEGYDIVCGWRYKRQDKLITRKIPSVVANWLIGKITGVPIKDNGCSLKAYRAGIIKSIPLYSDMHRFIPAMTSLAGTSVAELKVNHHPRRFGVSKYGITRIYKVLVDLLVIKILLSFSMRPLRLFATAGIVSLLAAILLLTVSITGLFEGELEMNFMVASGALLFGILSFFFVLIGLLSELVLKTGNFPDLFHLKARTE
jgi:glycosyltransferase involved in cell wall biosynthesis